MSRFAIFFDARVAILRAIFAMLGFRPSFPILRSVSKFICVCVRDDKNIIGWDGQGWVIKCDKVS